MKRLAFIGALFGISKAQVKIVPTELIPGGIGPGWTYGPKLNNQCPVCGNMADPLPKMIKSGLRKCVPTGVGHTVTCEDVLMKNVTSTMVRCNRCNAAFYQDAE